MQTFPEIEGLYIDPDYWADLISWRPGYWTKLPFDLRQQIDQETVTYAENLLRNESYDQENYRYFHRWKGHAYALDRIAKKVKRARRDKCFNAKQIRAEQIEKYRRTYCGARKKNGAQCKGLAEPGRNRCRFHGGKSTGPVSIEGKLKALSCLPQYKKRPELLEVKRKELEQAA